MLRRVLSLLLILPLLLPQGMCICDLAHSCRACEANPCTVSQAPAPQRTACKCCKHKRTGSPGRPDRVLAQSHTCRHSIPAKRDDDKHAPCCPAKAGFGLWKTEPTSAPTVDTPTDWQRIASASPPAQPAAVAVPGDDLHPSGPLLYLTLLTLLI